MYSDKIIHILKILPTRKSRKKFIIRGDVDDTFVYRYDFAFYTLFIHLLSCAQIKYVVNYINSQFTSVDFNHGDHCNIVNLFISVAVPVQCAYYCYYYYNSYYLRRRQYCYYYYDYSYYYYYYYSSYR